MTKKNDPNQFIVQAYQSPYTQELFSTDNKEEFEKHLRQEARHVRDKANAAAATQERLRLWADIRQSATSMDDVSRLVQELPEHLEKHYNKTAFFKSSGNTKWSLTVTGKTTLGLQSITHASPIGQETNWGGKDKSRPVRLLGLSGKAAQSLNYKFYGAKHESGIDACNHTFVLFADDWPFVAKMALMATFDKTIEFPEKYVFNSGARTEQVKPEYTRFWNDIDRYSMEYAGMAYGELQGMRDSLGLSRGDLESMIQSYAIHKHNAPPTTLSLALPDGMEEQPETVTPEFGV